MRVEFGRTGFSPDGRNSTDSNSIGYLKRIKQLKSETRVSPVMVFHGRRIPTDQDGFPFKF
jgi:hypothetical protein